MEKRPIVIVGGGPGGCATALALHDLDPGLASEILVLEKAKHPRPKVCAGGLIPSGRQWLERHNVPFDLPHVAVHRARARTPKAVVDYSERDFCFNIRRDELDAALVRACQERGIEVQQQRGVKNVHRADGRAVIETDAATYGADLVVGADGSGSLVRRRLVGDDRTTIARAAMCDVPVREAGWDGFADHRSDFDFTDVPNGLSGYRWSFPCLIDGVPHANVGVYSLDRGGAAIRQALAAETAQHGARDVRHCAFPIRWYRRHRTRVASDNVLLVGDAAGADPLMGEGISLALEYGSMAAAAAVDSLRIGDRSGDAYQRAIDSSWLGRKLGRLHTMARWIYGGWWRACFAVPERSLRMRALGLRWYNGIDDWDKRTILDAGWSMMRPDFVRKG